MIALSEGGTGAGSAATLTVFLIELGIIVICFAGMWKVFDKAGQPGWSCLVPIYNIYSLCKVAGKPGWWVILLFIPIVNLIIGVIILIGVAGKFGKGVGFALGLLFLPFIFYPILGFGDAAYTG